MLTGPEKFRPGIPGFAEFADDRHLLFVGHPQCDEILALSQFEIEAIVDI